MEDYTIHHMAYVESTGLVDYSALPEPSAPGSLLDSLRLADLVVPGLVITFYLFAAVVFASSLRKRTRRSPGSLNFAP